MIILGSFLILFVCISPFAFFQLGRMIERRSVQLQFKKYVQTEPPPTHINCRCELPPPAEYPIEPDYTC